MLDDLERMAELDPEHMGRAIQGFPDQLHTATTMALPPLGGIDTERVRNICFVGMGGSGAGGTYAQAYLDQHGGPVSRVVHDYALPLWVGDETLVIVTSYSGGTEETLACIRQAMRQGAQWIGVSSGGDLEKVALRHGVPHIKVPGGLPPRGAFGHLTVPILRILGALDIVDRYALETALNTAESGCRKIADAHGPQVPTGRNPAKRLAEALHTRTPLLVVDTPFAHVAERVRCQLNENSKVLAFTRTLPEANHNDTVAWTADAAVERWIGLFVGPFDRNPALAERARFVREVLEDRGVPVVDLDVPAEEDLVRALLVTYLGDWVSLYLAYLNGEDPSDVGAIPRLKGRAARTGYVAAVRKDLGIDG